METYDSIVIPLWVNRCLLFTFGAGALTFGRQRLVVWHVPWSQLWKVLEQRLGLTGFWFILLKCLHSLLLFLSTHTNPSEENVIVVRLSWSIVLDRKALKDTIWSICSLSVGCRGYNCTVICTTASQETCDTTWSRFYPCKSGGFLKQLLELV